MQYKKLLAILGLVAAFAKAIPIPQESTDVIGAEPVEIEPVVPAVVPAVGAQPEVEISENVQGFVNYILSNISYTIKTLLEKELGSEINDPATSGIINNVIVDVLSKTNEDITTAIVSVLGDDTKETAAAEAASKVAEILSTVVTEALTANVKEVDAATVSQSIVAAITEVVEKYIQSNFETSKIIVPSEDVAAMVINGADYLVRENLCKTVGVENAAVCATLTNTIMDVINEPLKEIINNNISNVENDAMTVGCSAIPAEMFKTLGSKVTEAITEKLDAEKAPKATYPVLALVANVVENILCVDRADVANDQGKVIINNVKDIGTSIINKVNQINNEVNFAIENAVNDKVGVTSSMAVIKNALN